MVVLFSLPTRRKNKSASKVKSTSKRLRPLRETPSLATTKNNLHDELVDISYDKDVPGIENTTGFDNADSDSDLLVGEFAYNENFLFGNTGCDKAEVYKHNNDHRNWERIDEVLINKGMADHFHSTLGGEMKDGQVKYLIRKTAVLLTWTYEQKNQVLLPKSSVIEWFHILIVKEYILIQTFTSQFLAGYRQLLPSTCLNYVNDFTKAINWFLWFRENRDVDFPTEGASSGGIIYLCSKLKRSFKSALKKQRLNKTMEHLVESGTFPVGGLLELQGTMADDILWAKEMTEYLAQTCPQSYNKFLSILIGSMYCESPQGRIGGIYIYILLLFNMFIALNYAISLQEFKT